MVSSSIVLFLAASASPSVLGFEKYTQSIPNGDAFGKELGHATKGYTPFGTLFSGKGKTWTGACKELWPGQTKITVGAVLGDPCCKWTSGKPDFVLTAPNLAGTVCAGAAGAAPATPPASKAPSPVAPPPSAPATKPTTPVTAPVVKPAPPAEAPVSAPIPAPPAGAPVAAPTAEAPVAANTTAPIAPLPAGVKPAGKTHRLCVN